MLGLVPSVVSSKLFCLVIQAKHLMENLVSGGNGFDCWLWELKNHWEFDKPFNGFLHWVGIGNISVVIYAFNVQNQHFQELSPSPLG